MAKAKSLMPQGTTTEIEAFWALCALSMTGHERVGRTPHSLECGRVSINVLQIGPLKYNEVHNNSNYEIKVKKKTSKTPFTLQPNQDSAPIHPAVLESPFPGHRTLLYFWNVPPLWTPSGFHELVLDRCRFALSFLNVRYH